MKKFLLILLFIMFATSCNKYIVTNLYEKEYRDVETEIVYTDVYSQLYKYDLDSIPLNEWITSKLVSDTINIEQKMVRKIIDEKTVYTFIFTEYSYPSIKYFKFLIRYKGKKLK